MLSPTISHVTHVREDPVSSPASCPSFTSLLLLISGESESSVHDSLLRSRPLYPTPYQTHLHQDTNLKSSINKNKIIHFSTLSTSSLLPHHFPSQASVASLPTSNLVLPPDCLLHLSPPCHSLGLPWFILPSELSNNCHDCWELSIPLSSCNPLSHLATIFRKWYFLNELIIYFST